jgi:dCTP deaminase
MALGKKDSLAEKRAAALRENLKRRKQGIKEQEKGPMSQTNQTALCPEPASEALPGIMPDHWIREQAATGGMIEPFAEKQNREVGGQKIISYGLSSYGYDARCSDEFMIFTNVDNAIVDPKDFSNKSFVERKTDVCVIPPNSFVLTRTIEYFRIPKDVLVVCLGKSTYARCGLIVNVTPLEPGWEGHVTLEISNTTPLPARVYANEGIAQFLFFKGSSACEVSYADRAGKYMAQRGVTLPRI